MLYPNERKGVRKALTIGTLMFFIGVLLGYFMVYRLTLRFLSTYQLSSAVENILSLNSYIDNFMMLILCMGLAFELPLVTCCLLYTSTLPVYQYTASTGLTDHERSLVRQLCSIHQAT